MSAQLDVEYEELLEAVHERFMELPRGAKMTASYDLRIAPAMISQVLNGYMKRKDILERLFDWAVRTTPEDVARRKDSTFYNSQVLTTFLHEFLERDPTETLEVRVAYKAYEKWTQLQGYKVLKPSQFVALARQTLPLVSLQNGKKVFAGVTLPSEHH